jgi:hypothetical protein
VSAERRRSLSPISRILVVGVSASALTTSRTHLRRTGRMEAPARCEQIESMAARGTADVVGLCAHLGPRLALDRRQILHRQHQLQTVARDGSPYHLCPHGRRERLGVLYPNSNSTGHSSDPGPMVLRARRASASCLTSCRRRRDHLVLRQRQTRDAPLDVVDGDGSDEHASTAHHRQPVEVVPRKQAQHGRE